MAKMRIEPGAYGKLGLSDLFEMREECLREFGFSDVYRHASTVFSSGLLPQHEVCAVNEAKGSASPSATA